MYPAPVPFVRKSFGLDVKKGGTGRPQNRTMSAAIRYSKSAFVKPNASMVLKSSTSAQTGSTGSPV